MSTYYARFQSQAAAKGKHRKTGSSFVYRCYRIDQPSYHAALCATFPIIPFLLDEENTAWRLLALRDCIHKRLSKV